MQIVKIEKLLDRNDLIEKVEKISQHSCRSVHGFYETETVCYECCLFPTTTVGLRRLARRCGFTRLTWKAGQALERDRNERLQKVGEEEELRLKQMAEVVPLGVKHSCSRSFG